MRRIAGRKARAMVTSAPKTERIEEAGARIDHRDADAAVVRESSDLRYPPPPARRGNSLSQTAELARVKARIKALTDKTVANGCTEAEAMAAAEMVGRLLERYALSMDEIEVREARCVQAEVPLGGRRRRPIDGCVPAIARLCDCKVWLARAARQHPDAADVERTTRNCGRCVWGGRRPASSTGWRPASRRGSMRCIAPGR